MEVARSRSFTLPADVSIATFPVDADQMDLSINGYSSADILKSLSRSDMDIVFEADLTCEDPLLSKDSKATIPEVSPEITSADEAENTVVDMFAGPLSPSFFLPPNHGHGHTRSPSGSSTKSGYTDSSICVCPSDSIVDHTTMEAFPAPVPLIEILKSTESPSNFSWGMAAAQMFEEEHENGQVEQHVDLQLNEACPVKSSSLSTIQEEAEDDVEL